MLKLFKTTPEHDSPSDRQRRALNYALELAGSEYRIEGTDCRRESVRRFTDIMLERAEAHGASAAL